MGRNLMAGAADDYDHSFHTAVGSSPRRVRKMGPAAASIAPRTTSTSSSSLPSSPPPSASTDSLFRKLMNGMGPTDATSPSLPASSSPAAAAAVTGGGASPGHASSASPQPTSYSSSAPASAQTSSSPPAGPSSTWPTTAAAAIAAAAGAASAAAASFTGGGASSSSAGTSSSTSSSSSSSSSSRSSVPPPRPPKPLPKNVPTTSTSSAGSIITTNARLDPRFHSGGRGGPSSSSSLHGNNGNDDILHFNVEAGQAGGEDAFESHPGFFSKDSYKIRPSGREPRRHWVDSLPPFLNPRKLTRRQQALCLIFSVVALIVLIVIVSFAAKGAGIEGLGGGGDQGAAETGNYRNLFAEIMGKTAGETDAKLEEVWTHFFNGDIETTGVYVEVEPNMAQIINTESNVVTSEGISYGMITCVHLEKQEVFNRLWNWARFHMQHTAGTYEAFFAWRVTRGGLLIDAKDVIPAPDAEAYIATALIAAHRKWGSTTAYPYKAEAMRLIHAMGNWQKGFFTKDGKATFNPTDWGLGHSNPSYHLPHFYEAFARFLKNENDPRAAKFWSKAAKQSRKFFHVAAHAKTGLLPDYTTLEGKKAPDPNLGGHANFQWDAWRAPANVAVDWAWWNEDGWQQKYADRFLGFFVSQGPKYGSQFTMEGKVAENNSGHDAGLVSMNAVVALAARDQGLKAPFVKELWEQGMPEGKGRYYPAMLYMMGLLHCSGKFKAYF